MHLFVEANSLRTPIADKKIQCCVTSPPYWGLRAYKVSPTVWPSMTYAPMPGVLPVTIFGCDPECEHDWAPGSWRNENAWGGSQRGSLKSTLKGRPSRGQKDFDRKRLIPGETCQKCGGWRGCLGHEPTPLAYIGHLILIFREVRRVLRDDGTFWLNMGDSYAGSWGSYASRGRKHQGTFRSPMSSRACGLKRKDLCAIPWRLALALQADGWWLRSEIIWHKPNAMPENLADRPSRQHEHLFMLSKSEHYYYDREAIKEPKAKTTIERAKYADLRNKARAAGVRIQSGLQNHKGRNPDTGRDKRTVWKIPHGRYPGAHFATFPEELVEPCIKAGTSAQGCCSICGAPLKRVLELVDRRIAGGAPRTPEGDRGVYAAYQGSSQCDREGLTESTYRTTGWKPTCSCNSDETKPCIVLDPFMGSGTTAKVAARLGRDCIGLDLSGTYLREQAGPRLEAATQMEMQF